MAATYNTSIESVEPLVEQSGLNTNKAVDFSGATSVALPSTTTINGSSVAGIGNITSSATTGNMLTVTNTGVYTGTGVSTVTADSATTGTVIAVSANGLTSGNAIRVQSSSTDTTAHNLIHAINSGAASVASLFGGTQVVISTHFRKILTESGSGVTLYFSDGTTANGALTGAAGDICFNAGSNKPEYCTGTTNWTALV